MKTEAGRSWSDAAANQGHRRLPAATRSQVRHRIDSPSAPPQGINPIDTVILDFLASKTVQEYISVLRQPVFGNLLQQP